MLFTVAIVTLKALFAAATSVHFKHSALPPRFHTRQASCACGYVDNTGSVWREAIESDFTRPEGALSVVSRDWDIMTWLGTGSGTTLPRQNVAENVFQHQDALGLKTSAYTGSGPVKVSEIDSKRSDILFGTFRMRAQIPDVPGVVFGFFSYKGEPLSEIDIEFLTSYADYYQRAHYTNQPGSVPDAYHNVVVNGADFTTFGEHRFDWHPTATTFYYNGGLTSTITKNVPSIGSAILANVWSNGDPNWSAGPPTQDAIATLQYIKLYFNSTSMDEVKFSTQCAASGHVSACII